MQTLASRDQQPPCLVEIEAGAPCCDPAQPPIDLFPPGTDCPNLGRSHLTLDHDDTPLRAKMCCACIVSITTISRVLSCLQ
jgi:hypothetical protein